MNDDDHDMLVWPQQQLLQFGGRKESPREDPRENLKENLKTNPIENPKESPKERMP